MGDKNIIDLRTLTPYTRRDRGCLPRVEADWVGVRQVVIGDIGRYLSSFEYYAPMPPDENGTPQGGALVLSQAQVRHIHAELGVLINGWDNTPRDLIAEADTVLCDAGHLGRSRASQGFEIETDGTTVFVYHHDGRGRDAFDTNIARYADTLEKAGYTGPGGSPRPLMNASDYYAACVEAIPPAATSF